MSVEGPKSLRGPIRWPPPSRSSARPGHGTGSTAYLLDADDDLAQELDARVCGAARPATAVPVLDVAVGSCDLRPWFEAVGAGPGLLILDGLLAFETCVGDRTASDLTGAGDLLQPPTPRPDELVAQHDGWRTLWPTRCAVLNQEFAERVRPWPQIAVALLRRAARRTTDADALRAIACQPRLEVRLVLLLWHLATRWGRVEPGGIHLVLPLTHRLLGQMVAAERPSVSHALSRLAHNGVVTGNADDLHLHGTLDDQLQTLFERSTAVIPRSAGQVA